MGRVGSSTSTHVSSDGSNIAAESAPPDFLWVRGGDVFTLRMALAPTVI